ncbi:MAG TPA: hypothetical protein VJM08_07720 [Anaerolineales bacterium]|nr:hypothetical protein [Anaerolineales bacterium]
MLAYSYLKLKIGAPVQTNDGLFGHIHQVIFSPLQQRIVGVVIRAHLLPPRDWALPIELIADVNDERVVLWVSREDILKQPMFDPSLLPPLELEIRDEIYQ